MAAREALQGLAALPEMQREVMVGTAVDGMSHEEVADALGLSSGAVRGLIYRARATLRAAAAAVLPGPVIGWAVRNAERTSSPGLYEALAGGGSAGLGGVVLKGGAIAVTAGALATAGITTRGDAYRHHEPRRSGRRPRSRPAPGGTRSAPRPHPRRRYDRAAGDRATPRSIRARGPRRRRLGCFGQPPRSADGSSSQGGPSPGSSGDGGSQQSLSAAPLTTASDNGGRHHDGGSGQGSGGPSTPTATTDASTATTSASTPTTSASTPTTSASTPTAGTPTTSAGDQAPDTESRGGCGSGY
jgi:hypothetical protein